MSAAERGVQDMPESRNRESLEQIKRNPIYLAQHVDDPAFTFVAGPRKKSARSKPASSTSPAPASHCVGTSTRPAAASCANPTKPAARTSAEGTTDHSNWETIEGISLSKLRMNKLNGEDSSSAEFTDVKFNPAVDPKLFEKPSSATAPAK